MVGRNLQTALQLVEDSNFSVSSGGTLQTLDSPIRVISELCPEDVIGRHDSFQRRMDHLDWRSRDHVKLKLIPFDAAGKNLRQELYVVLEANLFSDFVKVSLAHLGVELRIVQQQIGKLRALLHQVQLCHALRFALELFRRDAKHLAQCVSRIVESKGLIKVASKNIAF